MTLSLARLGFMGGAGALGKLELIQTQTVTSAVSYVDFLDNLGTYKTHLLTFQNDVPSGSNPLSLRYYESGTLETAAVYEFVHQYVTTGGGESTDERGTAYGTPYMTANSGFPRNGYIYFHNLVNSSYYSYASYHTVLDNQTRYGFSMMKQASAVNGIRLLNNGAVGTITQGDYSLYGFAT
tara:strand:+ start:17 stop:559 length:543 start_codon:yes stop_codon:yes gene_type:complete